jgi:hypothetical protein
MYLRTSSTNCSANGPNVPADLIDELLSERPDIVGLGVAGMPPGSPGMEGGNAVPYDVVAFAADGLTWVYASR